MVLLTVVVAVLSALSHARTLGKVEPIEALQEGSSRRRPMTGPGGCWACSCGVALVMLLVLPDLDLSWSTMLVMIQGFLALIGLVHLAPVIVARLVSGLASATAPGPGTLVQGHAAWNAARTASLAKPARCWWSPYPRCS